MVDGRVRRDVEQGGWGSYAGLLVAGRDGLRDDRWVVGDVGDFGGLRPGSQQGDYLTWFAPRSALLAAGPHRIRMRQALALREAGILRVVGPEARLLGDLRCTRFLVSCPSVGNARV